METSVVIPAYKAKMFVHRAVASAESLANVKEILLVEDGSEDGTLEVCRNLESRYQKVRLLTHPGGANLGASASRNLGIRMASREFVSFLDADDYYLPLRFEMEQAIFDREPDADGVYGATGVVFLTALGETSFKNAKIQRMTTLTERVEPSELVRVLLGASKKARGHIHLDALTVRKSLFEKAGYFDPELPLGQDTDLIIRMAVKGKLVGGMIGEPVAMRGMHDSNRITNQRAANRLRETLWAKVANWGEENGMPEELVAICRQRSLSWRTHRQNSLSGLIFLFLLPLRQPSLWSSAPLFRRVLVGVFGDNRFTGLLVRLRRFPKT